MDFRIYGDFFYASILTDKVVVGLRTPEDSHKNKPMTLIYLGTYIQPQSNFEHEVERFSPLFLFPLFLVSMFSPLIFVLFYFSSVYIYIFN